MDEIRVKNLVELKRRLENIFDERVRGLYERFLGRELARRMGIVEVRYYPHENGAIVDSMAWRQWVYIRIYDKSGIPLYDVSLNKILRLRDGMELLKDVVELGAVEERLYGEKGFTDKVYRILETNGIMPRVDTRKYDAVARYYVPGRLMLKIAEVLPRKNVEEEKHNEAPVFRDLLALARLIPDDTYYQIIVVGKERNDERVSIEGVCVKKNYWDKMEKTMHGEEADEVVRLLKYYLGHRPDNIWNEVLDGEEYVCMWWD